MATLKVTVHEAREVPIMDRTTGLADPYVVVKLDDLEYTTEIVHMSRHPVWNKVFRLDTPDLLILQEDPLEIRLYDHDIFSRDDIVGHTFVDCNSMVLQSNPSMSGWFPLFDTSAGGIRGEIRLTIKIKFHTAENPLAPRLPTRYVPRPSTLLNENENINRSEEQPPSPAILPILHFVEELEPLRVTRMYHPSLTAEEEGILIFSAWRLDPSVYRVESVLTMVEELIVKADPEHSKLTNLRSTRTTNEARIVQLYKLSGKVRRQLARKVVEMQCNAVLGYVEEFDMESNGIIVRAYGTPCVLSAVKFVDREKAENFLLANPKLLMKPVDTSSGCMSPVHESFNTPLQFPAMDNVDHAGSGAVTPRGFGTSTVAPYNNNNNNNNNNSLLVSTGVGEGGGGGVTNGINSSITVSASVGGVGVGQSSQQNEGGDGMIAYNIQQLGNNNNNNSTIPPQPQLLQQIPPSSGPLNFVPTTHEVTAITLPKAETSATETPSQQTAIGIRPNVLILTLKDLPSGMVEHIGGHISARSVKIVAKMKSKQMISQERDAWWMELREELKANARAFHCNVILGYEEVVLYHEDVVVLSLSGTAVMLNHSMHPLRGGPEYLYQRARKRFSSKKNCSILHLYRNNIRPKDVAGELGDFIACNVCHRKSVPEVLLVSCAMPQDLVCEGQPRLVQAVVSKSKSAVRGVDLALAVSQALPYIEYSLHKQLLFNLKLQELNAVFGLRITICISFDTIIGTLTGTGCRLMGLPAPSLPRLEVLDSSIRRHEAVMRLEDIVTQQTKARKRNRRNKYMNGIQKYSPASSSSNSSNNGSEESSSSATWADEGSGSDTGSEQESYGFGKVGRVADYVVKIDDEEEAEMMLGMIGRLEFEDSVLLTIPYVPDSANAYASQERIVMNRRYTIQRTNSGTISTGTINECFADAKKAYVQSVCRVALRRYRSPLERLCVMGFTFNLFFEPNSGALHLRLEGCLMTSTTPQRLRLAELEERSFKECLRYVEGDPRPVPIAHHSRGDSTTIIGTASVDNNNNNNNNNNGPRGSACSARTIDGSSISVMPLNGVENAEKIIVQYYERSIFVMSNAPYGLPFIFKRDISPPLLWLNEGSEDCASIVPEVSEYYKDNRTRHGMVGRQWQAFTSLASTAFRNLIEKTGVTSDGKSVVDARNRENGISQESSTGGGPLLHQPVRRLPTNFNSLESSDSGVIFTPLDYIAGQAIARYVGRLSQHFIREAYEIDSCKDLGVFFQQTDFEMQCVVQAMVRLMGGNALLKHRVTYHEVWDSDGSGCASVFVTVTGDVVQTSNILLSPLISVKEVDTEDDSDY